MTDKADLSRRHFLMAATALTGGVGVAATAVPFVASFRPSARAQALGAPVEVDISKLEQGQLIRVEWRGKPVWVLQRTEENLEVLASQQNQLRDPDSAESEQPEGCTNPYRSLDIQLYRNES